MGKKNPDVHYFDVLGDWTVTPNATLNEEQQANNPMAFVRYSDPVTTYVDFFGDLSIPFQNGDFWIVGAEHIITEHTKEVVHHLVLNGLYFNENATTFNAPASIYIWAPGAGPMVLNH